MPDLQSIAIDDRESTPVTHTFTPRSKDNGVGVCGESSGVPLGENTLSVSMRRAGTKYKGRLRIAMPVVVTQTIDSVDSPLVTRTAYADVQVSFDQSSSTQERDNLVGMLANALGSSKVLVNDCFVELEGIY